MLCIYTRTVSWCVLEIYSYFFTFMLVISENDLRINGTQNLGIQKSSSVYILKLNLY